MMPLQLWPVFEKVCDYSFPQELGRLAQLSTKHNKYVTKRRDYLLARQTFDLAKHYALGFDDQFNINCHKTSIRVDKIWLAKWCFSRCDGNTEYGLLQACKSGNLHLANWFVVKGATNLHTALVEAACGCADSYSCSRRMTDWLKQKLNKKQ